MLHRMSSLNGPLFRGQNQSSPANRMRKSKITVIGIASLLVVAVTCVALVFVFSGPKRDTLHMRHQRPDMARQFMANFSFDAISGFVAVAQAGGSGRPSVGHVPAEPKGQGASVNQVAAELKGHGDPATQVTAESKGHGSSVGHALAKLKGQGASVGHLPAEHNASVGHEFMSQIASLRRRK